MRDPIILAIVGIICLTIIEVVALIQGMDGQIMATVLTIIAALAGIGGGIKIGREKRE